MNKCIVIVIVVIIFSSFHVNGQQMPKGTFIVSGTVGVWKPSTYSGDYNKHPFMTNIKSGYFIKHNIAIGIEFQYTKYTESESGEAALQQPGSSYIQSGIIKDKYVSIGLTNDLYTPLSSKFLLATGVYVHYLYNSFVDKGEYYSNGAPAGIGYIRSINFGYFARMGTNLTLYYSLRPKIFLALRCVEFEYRLRRKYNYAFIAAPLQLGIQYHFKPQK